MLKCELNIQIFAMSGLALKQDESWPPEPKTLAGTQVRQLRETAQKWGKTGGEHHNISEHITTWILVWSSYNWA